MAIIKVLLTLFMISIFSAMLYFNVSLSASEKKFKSHNKHCKLYLDDNMSSYVSKGEMSITLDKEGRLQRYVQDLRKKCNSAKLTDKQKSYCNYTEAYIRYHAGDLLKAYASLNFSERYSTICSEMYYLKALILYQYGKESEAEKFLNKFREKIDCGDSIYNCNKTKGLGSLIKRGALFKKSSEEKCRKIKTVNSKKKCFVCGNYDELKGLVWSGACKNGYIEGKGTLKSNDDFIIDGMFSKGVASGKIQLKSSSSVFEGTYKNGLKEGNAKINFKTGVIFKGKFVKGRPLENGAFICPDKRKSEYVVIRMKSGDWMIAGDCADKQPKSASSKISK